MINNENRQSYYFIADEIMSLRLNFVVYVSHVIVAGYMQIRNIHF